VTGYDAVVLISLDTLRADAVGASPLSLWPAHYGLEGHPRPRTEGLDRLAREGAFFANAVAAAPYTSASHGTFFTGRWPLRHGAHEFFNRALSVPTVFTYARALGWRTALKTDFPIILGRHLGFDRDVDHYLVEDDAGFLELARRTRPFLGVAHFGGLHIPYGFHNLRFGGDDYRRTVEALEAEVDEGFHVPGDQLVETYRSEDDLALLLRYKRVVEYHYSRGHYARLFGLYLEGVERFMRRRFEPFLEELTEALRGSRSLLVVFGDHGEEYDADSYGHHNSLSEGVVRVPVIFHGEGVVPALHTERVRTVDVLPTLLERLLPDGAPELDGVSLARSVWGGEPYPPRRAFCQAYTSDTAEFVAFQKRLLAEGARPGPLRHVRYKEAVYDGPFKLTRQDFHYTGAGGIFGLQPCERRTRCERFDGQQRPRPWSDAVVERELGAQLDAYNALGTAAGSPVELSDELRRQLRAMGYRI
jgi:hypothetical protein